MSNFYKTSFYQNFSCFSTAFKTIKRNIQRVKMEGEVATLDKFISNGSICIDIGGAYGRYALVMSKIVGKSGHIYIFEPGQYSFRVLSMVIKFHRLTNVTAVKKALSNREGTIKLITPIKENGKIGPSLAYISNHVDNEASSEEVEMTTLDNYCLRNKIERVDFIKCDTEGSEFLVFQGAKGVINKYRPVILSEIDRGHLHRYQQTTDSVEQFFSKLSYLIYIYKNGSFVKAHSLAKESNYFFIPQEKELQVLSIKD